MLELERIRKSYTTGDFTQAALKNVSLKFRSNEFVAILGPSGSGKTTLLNIIGGLDCYDSGDLIINNRSTRMFKPQTWDAYRNNCIGFIFQNYNLIPHISVLQNVEMGMTLSGISAKKRHQKAKEVLERVGLKDHINKKPNQLSGGQMQRVAIARALANDPHIILADEPTGALDTQTSLQIMELIKEIAQDKLVIMVTHNSELALKYANRIIIMRDGEVLKDTNPIMNTENIKNGCLIKRTSMNFISALKLSLNNLRTKKGRTFLTSFASSIGIIGIAAILALSNGFDNQINIFEKNTLSSMPIIISSQVINQNENQKTETEDPNFPQINYVISEKNEEENTTHNNNLTKDYLTYLEKINPDIVSGISYEYQTSLNMLNKVGDTIKKVNFNWQLTSIPKSLTPEKDSVIIEKYDLLAGREAKNFDELLLIVDSKNHVNEGILSDLNLNTKNNNITFNDILKSEVKLVLNQDYYEKNGNYFTTKSNLTDLYNSPNLITLKVVGIVRLKEDLPDYISTSSLAYTQKLMDYVINQNKNSDIVVAQKSANYNVITGEVFDTSSNQDFKTETLSYLGAQEIPNIIQIYPKNFTAKEELINYLDKYNQGKKETDKIIYTDQAKMISNLSGSIMDGITIVLISFSAISLVVSSIMIGIIMYISVLERTKEIGILRSLGARAKDISRVFNAETFIIGLTSGILGIILTNILLIPANQILYSLTELKNIAILNPNHALILIIISLVLTLIGGAIPAKIASKKDPVIALRTE